VTDIAAVTATLEDNTPLAPSRRGLFATIVRNPIALTGLILLTLIVLIAILAPVLAPSDPTVADAAAINAPPGTPGHFLGADSSGRDILSRLIFGARLTLSSALVAISVAMAIGIPSGLVAGYFGGWFDSAASWFANILMSVPGMVALLAVFAAVGPKVYVVMATLGLMISPGIFRLVRAQVIGVRNELYIDAARVSGLSNLRIIGRHVLFVVRAPIVIQSAALAGLAIIIQSGLQFIISFDPMTPSWGAMLLDAFNALYIAPTAMIWPGAAIALTVASLVLVGNGLRDAIQGVKQERSPRSVARRFARAHADTGLAPTGDHALEVRNLKIGYPQEDGSDIVVVEDVSLTVDRGEVLGLVGESGSGKTQTAFAVLGLLPRGGVVMGGSIFIEGKDVLAMDREARRSLLGTTIAYIPQEPTSNLDPAFTVGQQLVEPLTERGMKKKDAVEKVLGLLTEVGLPDPKRTFASYPHQVSGGQAQRVLIAGAISQEPVLLIADEPTTALDVTIQAEVLSLLRRLQRDRNMAVMLVTHNFGVVADLCDSVAVMKRGRVVEAAPVLDLFAAPEHPYTVMLLESTLDDTEPRPPLGTAARRLADGKATS
jgi:peptide/nickel transport system permease protein